MSTAPVFNFTDDEVQRFAYEMAMDTLRPPLKSAQAALGEEPGMVGKCLYAITEIVKDPRYVAHFNYYREVEQSQKARLPTKDEVLHRLWGLTEIGLPSDRTKNIELYCKVAGYLETGKASSVTINPVMHVMEVPVAQSDDGWESGLKQQQEKLMTNGSTH